VSHPAGSDLESVLVLDRVMGEGEVMSLHWRDRFISVAARHCPAAKTELVHRSYPDRRGLAVSALAVRSSHALSR